MACNKIRHTSLDSAKNAADSTNESGNSKKKFRVPYGPCLDCGGYHVGTTKKPKRKR